MVVVRAGPWYAKETSFSINLQDVVDVGDCLRGRPQEPFQILGVLLEHRLPPRQLVTMLGAESNRRALVRDPQLTAPDPFHVRWSERALRISNAISTPRSARVACGE